MHSIHALLSHATLRPDSPALISSHGILSWSALLARVRALAAGLASRGVTHRSRVACILHDDPVVIELMLAAHWLAVFAILLIIGAANTEWNFDTSTS